MKGDGYSSADEFFPKHDEEWGDEHGSDRLKEWDELPTWIQNVGNVLIGVFLTGVGILMLLLFFGLTIKLLEWIV